MKILAIETSCDETGVAVLEDGTRVLSNLLSSQVSIHAPFGGIVPELASRKHMEQVQPLVAEAVRSAGITMPDLDGVAATFAPGLIGALIVGVSFAKGLAYSLRKPLMAVHHLEGHIHSAFLEKPFLEFPFIALVVSGGHTDLYWVERSGKYKTLGRTLDDAAGEALDKAGKLLDLGYPGGPVIDRLAQGRDPDVIRFPRAFLGKDSYDFSFSGLKTSLRTLLERKGKEGAPGHLGDIASGFQEAIVDVLVEKSVRAMRAFDSERLIVVGGVAANSRLRARMKEEGNKGGFEVVIPSPIYCTDNAAMIARAAFAKWEREEFAPMDLNPSGTLRLEAVNR